MIGFQRLRMWLRQRRILRLRVELADLQGQLAAHRAAGYQAPSTQGAIARVGEEIRQLEALP